MYCPKCGAWVQDNERTCPKCGCVLGTGAVQNGFTEDTIPEEWKPITMWGYLGYQLLFAIPLVGLILILVFSFGGAGNRNLRNFARSYLCVMVIVTIVMIILTVAGVLSMSEVMNQINM